MVGCSYCVATLAGLILWPSCAATDRECTPSDDTLDESSVALQQHDSNPAVMTLSKEATLIDDTSNSLASSEMPSAATIKCWEGEDCNVTDPVVSAWFGASGYEWTSERGADVTAQVQKLVQKSTSFTADNDHFGDPSPWSTKVLMVKTQKAFDPPLRAGFEELRPMPAPNALPQTRSKKVIDVDKLVEGGSEALGPTQSEVLRLVKTLPTTPTQTQSKTVGPAVASPVPSPKLHNNKESLVDDGASDALAAEVPEPEKGLRGAGARLLLQEFKSSSHTSKSGTNTCGGGSFGDAGAGMCLDSVNWYSEFLQTKPWKVFSNGYQDSVLSSLFCTLGVTNRLFVDLGSRNFRTQLLQTQGWRSASAAAHDRTHENMHKSPNDSKVTGRGLFEDVPSVPKNSQAVLTTPGNITELFQTFQEHAGKVELDLATLADHSCDLQNFASLTKKFLPRVMTVEYQPRWAADESKTNVCKQNSGERFQWNGKDTLYGSSLHALRKAAQKQGYSMVYVERGVDAFFVRNDLLCKDTSELSLMTFQSTVGCNPWKLKDPTPEDMAKWIKDY